MRNMERRHKILNDSTCLRRIGAVLLALSLAAGAGEAQTQSRRSPETRRQPPALAPDPLDATATVAVRLGEDGVYEMKIGDASFRHAKWLEIEKRAIELLPGRTITFVNAEGKVLYVSPRAMIGILLEPAAGALAAQLNVVPGEALVITEVQPNLPGAKAGLAVHDVIIECNGRRPMTNTTFAKIIGSASPGDTMNVVLVRKGRETEVEVRLAGYDPVAMAAVRQPVGSATAAISPEEMLALLRQTTDNLVAVPQGQNNQTPMVSIGDTRPRLSDPNAEGIRAELDGIRRQLRRIEEALESLLLIEQQRQAASARSVGG